MKKWIVVLAVVVLCMGAVSKAQTCTPFVNSTGYQQNGSQDGGSGPYFYFYLDGNYYAGSGNLVWAHSGASTIGPLEWAGFANVRGAWGGCQLYSWSHSFTSKMQLMDCGISQRQDHGCTGGSVIYDNGYYHITGAIVCDGDSDGVDGYTGQGNDSYVSCHFDVKDTRQDTPSFTLQHTYRVLSYEQDCNATINSCTPIYSGWYDLYIIDTP